MTVGAPASAGAAVSAATALVDHGVVAGAAPSPTERVHARVVAATADPSLAAILTQRLAAGERCELVASVESFDALRDALADAAEPVVVVVDLSMPTGGPEDVCDALRALHPLARSVGIVPPRRSGEALITRGYMMGLGGLLTAGDDLGNGQLCYAVRCAAVGKLCYGPTVQAVLVERWGERLEADDAPATLLSDRELEVARLAVDGLRRSQIAEVLFLSPETVKRHLRKIRTKLGVTNPWQGDQLRSRLEEAGLLDEPDGDDESTGPDGSDETDETG